ncbi:nickel/cobalt transporter [Methyloceanibacter sp. wino2]|uniref:nickel/cobalt transporter n=1 Tax=Methyloceanibacter sp. wino2 TaxID=2170729 RepID=UPI00131F31CE|nr:nickel/cobalt transporter [Methyloceanibacter sp. wino2]
MALLVLAIMPFGQAQAQAQAPQSPPSAFGAPAKPQAPPSAFGAPNSAPGPQAAPVQSAPLTAQGTFGRLQTWIIQTQQKLLRPLAATIKKLKEGNAWRAGLWLAGLSFVYGIVHAAGPGHGKAIISSYVLANRETVRRGILISFLAAAVQGLMAVALVGVLIVALKGTGIEVNSWVKQLESASYALVFLVGLSLLVSTLWRVWRRRGAAEAGEGHDHHDHSHHHDDGDHAHAHDHEHGHHHHDHDHESCEVCGHIVDVREIAQPMTWRKIWAVVLSVGIRPCSGAVLVLVFALAQGLFWAGVASTFAMALGTAITVAVLASLAIGSRNLALAIGGENTRWAEAVWTVCAIGGALFVMTIGLLLFLASLGPARPF